MPSRCRYASPNNFPEQSYMQLANCDVKFVGQRLKCASFNDVDSPAVELHNQLAAAMVVHELELADVACRAGQVELDPVS